MFKATTTVAYGWVGEAVTTSGLWLRQRRRLVVGDDGVSLDLRRLEWMWELGLISSSKGEPLVSHGTKQGSREEGNMMNEVDIENLTIEKYLMLTQGNQVQGMVKNESGGMMKKDIENMTIAEYMKSRVLGYEHHSDNSNINAYLPPLLHCFKPIQPPTKNIYEPLEEKTDVISEDKLETVEQEMSTDEELSPDEDLDVWLNAEIEKCMCGQDKENEEDTLIDILKTLVGECKSVYTNKNTGVEASSCGTDKLPPNEINPGSFTLPCTINNLNLYVMANLAASVNVMPKSIFEHLKLASFKKTIMVVEMADMTKKAPLGIVENILVKIDKFLFLSNFVIIDMLGEPNETMILGIGEDRIKFDMDGGVSHSKIPVEKIHMANSAREEEYFNPLEIKNDVFSYESPACLLFEQHTQSCENESVDTLDLVQELEECGKDCGMWPTCNPDLSFCSGYDAIYEKGENGMLEQWMCFRDHERQSVRGNRMVFADFLKVRYGNKVIDDTTRERRYYEWVAENSEFNGSSITQEATVDNNPYSFDVEIDFGKTLDDPYSRRFDKYKENFDSEIEQLANEYDLRVGMKKYALDDIWEKCERFQDTECHWHDEGFEEEEQWESGIEKTCYTPPFVKSETFEVKRYSFKNKKSFMRITKKIDDAQPLGRFNSSRFMGMIRKEMDEEGRTTRKT
ncbi:phospholipase-like protein [Tanacetum coccineum]